MDDSKGIFHTESEYKLEIVPSYTDFLENVCKIGKNVKRIHFRTHLTSPTKVNFKMKMDDFKRAFPVKFECEFRFSVSHLIFHKIEFL